MLTDKKRQVVTISGGTASVNTGFMRGFIGLITITPQTSTTVWDLNIKDKDSDIIYLRTSETGTISDRAEIPVGLDNQEKFTMNFTNVTANEPITVVFRIREKY